MFTSIILSSNVLVVDKNHTKVMLVKHTDGFHFEYLWIKMRYCVFFHLLLSEQKHLPIALGTKTIPVDTGSSHSVGCWFRFSYCLKTYRQYIYKPSYTCIANFFSVGHGSGGKSVSKHC